MVGVERGKGRDGEAGEEAPTVAMVLVDVVVPTCGMSKHLQDRPHSSA